MPVPYWEAPALFASAPVCFPVATSVLVQVLVERGSMYDLAEQAELQFQPLAADLPGHVAANGYAFRFTLRSGTLGRPGAGFGDGLADFRAVGDIVTPGPAPSAPPFLAWRSEAAVVALAIGEPDTARGLSDEELELARAFGATPPWAWRCGPPDLSPAEHTARPCREAIEVLAGPDTGLEQARTRADLGALLRRGNQRVEARDLLRQAVDVAYRLGAPRAGPPGRDRPPRHRSQAPAGCCSAGSKRSPPASAASPSWPPKGSPTARSPKPCSSPPEPSRATSPTCSPSLTSTPAPTCLPPWRLPPKPSAPNHLGRGRRDKSPAGLPVIRRCERWIELPALERTP